MSREYRDNQCKVFDLFERQGQSGMGAQPAAPAQRGGSPQENPINESMWMGTIKRHCESRQHLRTLLDKHLKPHN